MNNDSIRIHAQQRLTAALQAADEMRWVISLIDEEAQKQPGAAPVSEFAPQDVGSAPVKTCKSGAPRPSGIPSNNVMFATVLRAAQKSGAVSLSGSEVVQAVREHFWPGVVGAQLLPSLHSAAKKGKLTKTPEGRFKAGRSDARNKEAHGVHTRTSAAS